MGLLSKRLLAALIATVLRLFLLESGAIVQQAADTDRAPGASGATE